MRIGIDLGGTKIEGLALSDEGRELYRRRVPAPRGNYDDTIRAVADLVEMIERAVAPASLAEAPKAQRPVGIGIPGAI